MFTDVSDVLAASIITLMKLGKLRKRLSLDSR
jgi:hypothetical protein